MPFIPHTPADTQSMLEELGLASIDALFDEIPQDLLAKNFQLPAEQNEMNMLQTAEKLAARNIKSTCFLGSGCYEHHIPAAVWDITARGEWMTAYTPYQAEASQGTLQLLYEFQTMIAELTGMDVANASMYDGATALAEAILMSIRLKKGSPAAHKILVPRNLHPLYRATLNTLLTPLNVKITTLDFSAQTGSLDVNNLAKFELPNDYTALVISQPNFFGGIEDVNTLTNWAHNNNMLVIGCVNPISLGILTQPGLWGEKGADIVCGEGQPLGIPMASGGPYLGFLACKQSYVRQMPGRIVGRTLDKKGKPGYTLTLQAREQHIRREKANSNICTNQGLLATAATIYMSLLGPEGLKNMAFLCHQNTMHLASRLAQIHGVSIAFENAIFHEIVVCLPKPSQVVLAQLLKRGILGGYSLHAYYPELKNAILICATEMRTQEEIENYATILENILSDDI